MWFNLPILSTLIWFPILGGLACLFTKKDNPQTTKILAFVIAFTTFLLSLSTLGSFNGDSSLMQFTERLNWLSAIDVNYALGVDGIALPLIILTTFITLIVIIAGFKHIVFKPCQYFAAFLIMEGLMIGVFSSLDAILFYVFWEAMLIPMFLIIGMWGGSNRVYATIKFFLYTFLGSVLMLVALIYMHYAAKGFNLTDTFAISTFVTLPLSLTAQKWIFFAFLIAFAVKVPMWPVHTWLPDAHTQAPTGGSVILAAITLKMGAYGFMRFILPITPDAARYYKEFIILLSLIAVVYIGFVALMQRDMKKLIAYSSIAHMGFVTLGLLMACVLLLGANPDTAAAKMGIDGAYMQMVSHGFISGAMFLCVGVLYDRMHSRQISDFGGVVNKMPVFAALFMLFAMANAGLPGTSGFVGEFLVIIAAFKTNYIIALCAATTLILGAAYTLWMYKRVVFGKVANSNVEKLTDIDRREKLLLILLAVSVLAFGIYPQMLFNLSDGAINNLITQIMHTKL